MDWNASLSWTLLAAFWLGALHALEPGHGKSIMGAYLIASRGGVRHALLLGVVVTATHTIVVFLLALAALRFAATAANERLMFWLELISGALVVGVGVWMILTSFELLSRSTRRDRHVHTHPHDHSHDHPHEHTQHEHHGHSHEASLPAGRNPLGFWTLSAVGASGGLVPCPAAMTTLLAAVNLGRPAAGIAVVGAMSLGIAVTLIAIGIAFVQAEKVATRAFGAHGLLRHAPRVSALVITALGVGLLARAFIGRAH